EPRTGAAHVFRAAGPGGAAPALVTDAALVEAVRAIAARGLPPAPRQAVLTLPSGERRDLDVVREAAVGAAAYAIGVDRRDPAKAYVLRRGPAGALEPVTDPAEVDRVRA